MPQMAPISWLLLFIFFSMIFILFNIMNYFMFIYPPMSSQINKKSTHSLAWKW